MSLLWLLIAILVVFWFLGGFVFHVAGGLIHILLVVALVLLIVNLIQAATGRGSRL